MQPVFSPDGRSLAYFADDQIWRVDLEAGTPVRIGSASGAILGATWTTDDLIVFSEGYRGGLSAVRAGGGETTELTSLDTLTLEASHRQAHALSGTELVLFRVNSGESSGIWLLDRETGARRWLTEGESPQYADGFLFFVRGRTLYGQLFDIGPARLLGEPVSLVGNVDNQYAVSETGTLLYLSNREVPESQLVLVGGDGTSTLVTPEPARYGAPSLSADGTEVAVAVREDDGNELRIYDLETGAERVVDTGPLGTPIWSGNPGSTELMYREDNSILHYDVAAGGASVPVLAVDGGDTTPTPVAWSRTGEFLYYVVDPETQGDLWVRDVDGRATPVFNGPEITITADLSPRNDRLAFTRGASGEDMRVHVTSTPFRAGLASIAISGLGASAPRWAPDGQAIYFVERSELVRIPIDAGGTPLLGERQTILRFDRRPSFTQPPYDVHPDGERLIVALPVRVAPVGITVTTGWLDSVRDRIR